MGGLTEIPIRPGMAEGRAEGKVRGSTSLPDRRFGPVLVAVRERMWSALRAGTRCLAGCRARRAHREGSTRGSGQARTSPARTARRKTRPPVSLLRPYCRIPRRTAAIACPEPGPNHASTERRSGFSSRRCRLRAVRYPAAPRCRERTTPAVLFLPAYGHARSAWSGCWPKG